MGLDEEMPERVRAGETSTLLREAGGAQDDTLRLLDVTHARAHETFVFEIAKFEDSCIARDLLYLHRWPQVRIMVQYCGKKRLRGSTRRQSLR
ncbi:hypothetical protein SAMN05444678_11284 [Sphingomonas sp. YR710]|uniref:hypothetical protein n=1 Tax=Sphingomonas sp. YR710 TaxID=1882773 RepID=UPI000883A1DF|nr:hypothetical protein [Sphingomonas sp. YR710]SDD35930.1 hypothetical protein SAMN05444678_11284 [Sphingomonas sp. YR710]